VMARVDIGPEAPALHTDASAHLRDPVAAVKIQTGLGQRRRAEQE